MVLIHSGDARIAHDQSFQNVSVLAGSTAKTGRLKRKYRESAVSRSSGPLKILKMRLLITRIGHV